MWISSTEGDEELIHTEDDLNPEIKSLMLHHFQLRHGDQIRTIIRATNPARSSTAATSDGYTVDLTDPILDILTDGKDVSLDPVFTVLNENFVI